MKNKAFWGSKSGLAIITVVCYVLIWSLILALGSSETNLAWLGIIPCAFFGWRSLNRIQPTMFLWLSFVGWIIYFFVKLLLSVVVGIFVAPYYIGRWLAERISYGMLQNNCTPLVLTICLAVATVVACLFLIIPSISAKKNNSGTVTGYENQVANGRTEESSTDKDYPYVPNIDDFLTYDYVGGD